MSNCSADAAMNGGRIKVVVVDDSALVRNLLTEIVNRQHDMTVVGTAADPIAARELIRAADPDVITLDVEMPRMDGLDFLERLMRLRPTPVVMVSTLTERGSEATLRALELGAVDFVSKPRVGIATGLEDYAEEIVAKIRVAARTKRRLRQRRDATRPSPAVLPALGGRRLSTEKLVFVGASTGGTEAIRAFLEALPADTPGILITQHMPPGFTKAFAQRLDGLTQVRVAEGCDGERVLPGHAYIAPGGRHMALARSGANYVIRLSDDPPVNRHRPSVEVLFDSAAAIAGRNAIGVMLTGMGKDGAHAMRRMRDAGAWNVAQDEATCVVFGMPKEAIALGAVHEVIPLDRIAPQVLQRLAAAGPLANRV